MQAAALQRKDWGTLADAATEAGEVFQNAGEKGGPHPAPKTRRANQRKGKGTMANERLPIQGNRAKPSRRKSKRRHFSMRQLA
jgi:hypothetical protein